MSVLSGGFLVVGWRPPHAGGCRFRLDFDRPIHHGVHRSSAESRCSLAVGAPEMSLDLSPHVNGFFVGAMAFRCFKNSIGCTDQKIPTDGAVVDSRFLARNTQAQ